MNIFYLNGSFVPEDEAKISITDLGLVRGYGVFDFLRTYNGKPFKLEEHLKRLQDSAKQIGLKISWTMAELKKLVLVTLEKNRLPEANIKIIVTGGISPNQIFPVGKPTLAILVYPPPVYPRSFYEKGVKVITVPASRTLPRAKTIDYISAIMALEKAHKEEAIEALYLNEQKEITEATTSNFFVFKGQTLITPKDGILFGITRQVVLDLSQKEFKKDLRPIKYKELYEVDEAFITATNKEVMPVIKVDNITIGDGKVGNNTKKIMELFKKYTQKV